MLARDLAWLAPISRLSLGLVVSVALDACTSERPTFGQLQPSDGGEIRGFDAAGAELDASLSVSPIDAAVVFDDASSMSKPDARGPAAPSASGGDPDASETGAPVEAGGQLESGVVDAGAPMQLDASESAAVLTDASGEPPSVCGDGIRTGAEICDDRVPSNELGACNPECTGRYVKRLIRRSIGIYSTDFGGPAGADEICTGDFGAAWKALLVAATRRATVTPFVGDDQLDWVLHKYTYYFNEENMLIWRTDTVALLGARQAQGQPVLAPLFDPFSESGGRYPWSGYNPDWTSVPDGNCSNWSSVNSAESGYFVTQDLSTAASEPCSEGWDSFILCVEQ